jgi:hypothetical protein
MRLEVNHRMQRYTVIPHLDGDKQQWLVQEVIVIGGSHDKHTTAACASEDEARLIALALEEYWDRRARRDPTDPEA